GASPKLRNEPANHGFTGVGSQSPPKRRACLQGHPQGEGLFAPQGRNSDWRCASPKRFKIVRIAAAGEISIKVPFPQLIFYSFFAFFLNIFSKILKKACKTEKILLYYNCTIICIPQKYQFSGGET
ncbi:MAG: hypothetical protein IJR88_05915, partial [Clostridia bacterium]|nr:hypothetical protein [Clostridia bacterium]